MFMPVSMSALAPLEVVPRDPFIVTAGTEGVVETVHVDPNAEVKSGDVLVSLEDTVLRNRYEIAEQEVGVAEASLKKAKQLSFVDPRGRHDLATAEAELTVRRAERDYAKEMLERSVIRADRAGVVLMESKRDLIGRPVATGEKLMEIVDPTAVLLNIDLPVADAIVLKSGTDVTVFLDSDPLHPVVAKLLRADYRARVHDQQQLAFRLVAEPATGASDALRLGVRGTAQVYSGKVSLGLYLFRRPLQAARRWLGL
jgi:multidrug resistance efflux pump